MVIINKAYKYRIYPDKEQFSLLLKTFGCCRFVYNKCLEEQERRYASGESCMSCFDMINYCTRVLKHENVFLKEPDKFSLSNSLKALDEGYKRFFRKQGGHPKFKSKHQSRMSYTTNITNGNIAVGDGWVKLPKLGRVKAVIHRHAPDGWKLKSATVSMERDGSCYVSVLYAYEQLSDDHQVSSEAVGLDYKSGGLYVDSNGSCPEMPGYYRRSENRLAHLQRKLSKCEKGSSNRKKRCKKVAKISRHVSNQRKDFLHKLSTGIANRYGIVCVEDLNMRSMANKGFGNGKATLDNGYGMFLNMLEYKLQDHGGVLVKVDKWFPSSQLCSCCGTRVPSVKDLSVRKWICPCCGTEHDRDVNAAKNILAEGLRMLAV